MLQFNFARVLKARGIEKHYTYLKSNGFADKLATRIKNNDMRRINLNTLEKLCLLFKCTPNDFIEWIPDENIETYTDQPLNQLKKSDLVVDITKTLNSVPLDKLIEIDRLVKEKLKD